MKTLTRSVVDKLQLEALLKSDEKTLEFLASIKWSDGFECRKCGNTNYCEGKAVHSRRCTRCKNEESATAHTIFHNCKFQISKAFYILLNVFSGEKELSSYELSDKLQVRQMTCWKFKKKVEECIMRQETEHRDYPISLSKILMNVQESKFEF